MTSVRTRVQTICQGAIQRVSVLYQVTEPVKRKDKRTNTENTSNKSIQNPKSPLSTSFLLTNNPTFFESVSLFIMIVQMNRITVSIILFTHHVLIHNHVAPFSAEALSSTSNVKKDKTLLQGKTLKGQMILAPLTRGGNLPFRRLCADFGMEVSLSEMIYARSLLRGDAVEQARLRRASNEQIFGIQFATNNIEEGCNAIKLAADSGADFCDLNCGCPIFEATRRGLGSSLLRSPKKLGKLVGGLVNNKHNMPVSVKIRLGCEADTINCDETVRELRHAGAVAITIHGRTAQQGYSKPADWDLIQQVVSKGKEEGYGHIPIIGNGDILTYYEATRRLEESSVDSVMVGRGALTKPWIFKEFKDKQTWNLDNHERIAIYRTLTTYMKDHFGDDEWGRKKSWNFLPWHFEFFARYTPFPQEEFEAQSLEKPLIQNRIMISDELSPLESLLVNRSSDAHNLIANALWESDSDIDAVNKLQKVAESNDFKDILAQGHSLTGREDTVLTNLPKGKAGKWEKRRGRKPGPKRSDEEIAEIRAQRAAKKAKILAEGGTWPPP